jgi:ubiquinone/menaquinone biosynthesis C-methylase UbiE
MIMKFQSPVPPACPEDLTQLELLSEILHCPQCGHDYECVDGVYDLLPQITREASSEEGRQLRCYSENFSKRSDRLWYQPLRRLAMSLSNGFLYRWAARQLEQFAGGYNLTLLDAACGDGTLKYYLSDRHAYIGVDFSSRVITRARRYHEGTFFCADLNRLPFPNNSFDAVVSLQSLSHLTHPENALAEIARLLKPEGKIFLSVPNHQSLKYRWQGITSVHTQHFGFENVKEMVSRLFVIQRMDSRGFWIPVPRLSLHVGLKVSQHWGIAFTIVASPKK